MQKDSIMAWVKTRGYDGTRSGLEQVLSGCYPVGKTWLPEEIYLGLKTSIDTTCSETLFKKEKYEMNINALVRLADKGFNAELKDAGISSALPTAIKEALERKMKEKSVKAADDAAETVMQFEADRENAITSRVLKIRALRREIDRLKREATEINDAAEFGRKTMNYLPLAAALGHNVQAYLKDYTSSQVAQLLKINTVSKKDSQD